MTIRKAFVIIINVVGARATTAAILENDIVKETNKKEQSDF